MGTQGVDYLYDLAQLYSSFYQNNYTSATCDFDCFTRKQQANLR